MYCLQVNCWLFLNEIYKFRATNATKECPLSTHITLPYICFALAVENRREISWAAKLTIISFWMPPSDLCFYIFCDKTFIRYLINLKQLLLLRHQKIIIAKLNITYDHVSVRRDFSILRDSAVSTKFTYCLQSLCECNILCSCLVKRSYIFHQKDQFYLTKYK